MWIISNAGALANKAATVNAGALYPGLGGIVNLIHTQSISQTNSREI